MNNIFAAGDVVERNEARNGRSASEQAHVVAQNIVRTIKGKPLLTYNPQWWEAAIKLTLGLVSCQSGSNPILFFREATANIECRIKM